MRASTERRLRRDVARRAGVARGEVGGLSCAYCGLGLLVDWSGDEPRFAEQKWHDYDVVCGTPAHLDHIIPECRNGPTSVDNTVIACAICNIAKGESALGDAGFLQWLVDRRLTVLAGRDPDFVNDRLVAARGVR